MENINKNLGNKEKMTLVDKIQLWFCVVAVAYFVIRFAVGVIFDI